MTESRFDDLARTLATPMPRRRALQLTAAALAALVLPGIRARPARAELKRGTGKCPPGGQLTCAQQFGPEVTECCSRPIPGSGNYTCCKPGECFYTPSTNTCCPKKLQCGKRCCPPDDTCIDGECVFCPKEQKCGKKCCFPPQKCRGGQCRCPDGRPACGKNCCPKGKVCSKAVEARSGKATYACCTPGKFNCGDGRCCDPDSCCGGKCCSKDDFCCGGKTCCKKATICASAVGGKKGKVCCPNARRVVKTQGLRACCPIGTVAFGNVCCPAEQPNCCPDDLACLGRQVCVRGVCQPIG